MFNFVMRPKARKALVRIEEERNRIEEAIQRARKSNQRVRDLYAQAQTLSIDALKWGKYL